MLGITWEEFGKYLFTVKRLKYNRQNETCYRTRFALIYNYFLTKPYTQDNLYSFFNFLQYDKKLSNSSCNNYLKLIKHLNNLLKMPQEFFKDFSYFAKTYKETEPLSPEETESLLVSGYKIGHRQGVIIEVLLKCALRNGELCNLTWDDIKPDKLILRDTKANKPQFVYISPELYKKIIILPHHKHNFIFAYHNGKLSQPTVNIFIREAARLAGIKRHIYCHMLRHTAGTAMYDATKDVAITQKYLRHADISTTMVYVHNNTDDLRRAYESLPVTVNEATFSTIQELFKMFYQRIKKTPFEINFTVNEGRVLLECSNRK